MWASTPTLLSQFVKTLKILCTKDLGYSIWQRNYYEHVIRNEKEHLQIIEYINNNPFNWINDKYFLK